MDNYSEMNIRLETSYKKFIGSKQSEQKYDMNRKNQRTNNNDNKDDLYQLFKRKEEIKYQNMQKRVKQS